MCCWLFSLAMGMQYDITFICGIFFGDIDNHLQLIHNRLLFISWKTYMFLNIIIFDQPWLLMLVLFHSLNMIFEVFNHIFNPAPDPLETQKSLIITTYITLW